MTRARRTSNKPKKGGIGRSRHSHPQASQPQGSEASFLVVLFNREEGEGDVLQHVERKLGKREIIRSSEFAGGALAMEPAVGAKVVVLSQLGVVLTPATTDQIQQLQTLAAADGSSLQSVALAEECSSRISSDLLVPGTATTSGSAMVGYLRGYRDAVNNLAAAFGVGPVGASGKTEAAPEEYRDDVRGTWGLHATGVLNSPYTGRGVRVAALVDGLNIDHRDWRGRSVVMKSFVPNESPTHGGATGTHYLGTAFGVTSPPNGSRYGCAPDAVLFVAKVLSQTGFGSFTAIAAALDWAVGSGCRVILVPLGWGGPTASNSLEMLASRVVARGGLLIASAGNNARRPDEGGFVVNPAACPSVLSVGSIDRRLRLAPWTPRSLAPSGGNIDIVAPGVDLRSSVPPPQHYASWSGSATAAAYVAGIAALWAEFHPSDGPLQLWRTLISHARPLSLPASDAGAGLIQSP